MLATVYWGMLIVAAGSVSLRVALPFLVVVGCVALVFLFYQADPYVPAPSPPDRHAGADVGSAQIPPAEAHARSGSSVAPARAHSAEATGVADVLDLIPLGISGGEVLAPRGADLSIMTRGLLAAEQKNNLLRDLGPVDLDPSNNDQLTEQHAAMRRWKRLVVRESIHSDIYWSIDAVEPVSTMAKLNHALVPMGLLVVLATDQAYRTESNRSACVLVPVAIMNIPVEVQSELGLR
jgi:hypothetical protein